MRAHLLHSILSPIRQWCSPRQWRRIPTVSPQQLQILLTHKPPPLVLDVRNPDEFVGERGHITGAVLVPLPELDRRLAELQPYRTRTIVTV